MDEKKELTRNERVADLADTLGKLGYKIRKVEFLIDNNKQDEEYASSSGVPYISLTLSI